MAHRAEEPGKENYLPSKGKNEKINKVDHTPLL